MTLRLERPPSRQWVVPSPSDLDVKELLGEAVDAAIPKFDGLVRGPESESRQMVFHDFLHLLTQQMVVQEISKL